MFKFLRKLLRNENSFRSKNNIKRINLIIDDCVKNFETIISILNLPHEDIYRITTGDDSNNLMKIHASQIVNDIELISKIMKWKINILHKRDIRKNGEYFLELYNTIQYSDYKNKSIEYHTSIIDSNCYTRSNNMDKSIIAIAALNGVITTIGRCSAESHKLKSVMSLQLQTIYDGLCILDNEIRMINEKYSLFCKL